MQKAKTFFYVSLGFLVLAVAFHMGAQTVESQTPAGLSIVGFAQETNGFYVILDNGDVWSNYGQALQAGDPPSLLGNFWGSKPVQTTETTWGRVKAEKR